MRILLISEGPIILHKGNYYAKDTWINFPIFFSNFCDSFTIICTTKSLTNVNINEYYKLKINSVKFQIISDYSSFNEYYKKWFLNKDKWLKIFEKNLIKNDILWIRTPSPIMNLLFKSKLIRSKKIVCFLAGDVKAQSDTYLKSKGLKRQIVRLLINDYLKKEYRNYKYVNLLYVYSTALEKRFEKLDVKKIPFRTPIISKSDIFEREDTCLSKNIRIIRVSWLLPSKGLEFLIEAIKILKEDNYNITLTIIGEERENGYKKELENLVLKLKLSNHIKFLGWKKSDEINDYFKSYDIHVISSLSEGTPRVILESLSKGIPLITTKVGGISTMLEHRINCIMIKPKSSVEISNGIKEIINNKILRKLLIKNGLLNSKKWTLEEKSKEIQIEMKKLIKT